MRRRLTKILLALTVPLILAGMYQSVKLGVIGDFGSGNAVAAEIPYVGPKLMPLNTSGPIAYSYKCHPHGDCAASLTGTASRQAILAFCAATGTSLSYEGTDIQDREDIVDYVRSRFDQWHLIEQWIANPSDSTMVLFCYGGEFRRLYGLWEPGTERFAIWLEFSE